MKLQYLRHSRSGFTLAELILALSIMMMMGIMAIMVYFNVSETSRRLQLSREVSESARQITERIAQEIKQNGISLNDAQLPQAWQSKWNFVNNYLSDGNTVLAIGEKIFYYGKKDGSECTNKNEHCGLYVWEENKDAYNLVDAFRADDADKRVTIQDLKFYVTGGDTAANKVTLKMTLSLLPKSWVSANLIESTKLEIQTTFSERPYKIE